MKLYGILLITITGIVLPSLGLYAQKTIQGFVYQDKYRTPLDSVLVYTQSGNISKTDSTGAYHINIYAKDSIWFQFRDKITHKYPVDTIRDPRNFEVQIYLPKYYVQTPKGYLPTVTVRSRNYYEDSTAFREDYAKIFNYQKPGQALGESFGVGDNGGVAVDFDQIVNLFRFGYNKRQKVYQKFALDVEQEKYIDHRFTKKLVETITGLYDQARDEYMKACRPAYNQLIMMNDAQLSEYIKKSSSTYFQKKSSDKYEQNIFLSPYERKHQQD
ncbi:hypothetical protein SAMN05192529_101191 [Arachidicoccus rhizosphaerae]|uniref:CarboxypepD_reg-like domain-containing protein n=1 Tax=Arachidicoccus rhizosphaerae TaxID=551991 RepID=A0A1H3VKZ0_9BACT|nr:hypothetical protein [Arachidicoccus rhizosphaerae]SDZ74772.1 hypothetical protein SAMN05192529_101191 [Arachidicoccus rhizosphaerae]